MSTHKKEDTNEHIEDIQHHIKVYMNVFMALAVLTIVTVATVIAMKNASIKDTSR